jgi:hypothetical protein
MALIRCSECRSDVSSLAVACPKCGAPVPKPKKKSVVGQVLLWSAAAVGALIVVGMIGEQISPTPKMTPEEMNFYQGCKAFKKIMTPLAWKEQGGECVEKFPWLKGPLK